MTEEAWSREGTAASERALARALASQSDDALDPSGVASLRVSSIVRGLGDERGRRRV